MIVSVLEYLILVLKPRTIVMKMEVYLPVALPEYAKVEVELAGFPYTVEPQSRIAKFNSGLGAIRRGIRGW